MSGPITPITTAPAAFTGIVEKVNEVIAANPPLQAGIGIQIQDAEYNRIISVIFPPPNPAPFVVTWDGISNLSVNGGFVLLGVLSTTPYTVAALDLTAGTHAWLKVTSSDGYTISGTPVIEVGTAFPTAQTFAGSSYTLKIPIGFVSSGTVKQLVFQNIILGYTVSTNGVALLPL